MLTKIAAYITGSKIARQNSNRHRQFLNWNKIEKIALFIDNSESVNKNETDKLLEGLKKHIEVCYLQLNSKQPAYGDWKCLVKKDKNILSLPVKSLAAELQSKNYDLIVSVSKRYPLYSANAASQVKSSFKCGNKNLFGELDLIIERKDSQDLISYLKEVFKYLQMIKTG
jgi:hypothetical protein